MRLLKRTFVITQCIAIAALTAVPNGICRAQMPTGPGSTPTSSSSTRQLPPGVHSPTGPEDDSAGSPFSDTSQPKRNNERQRHLVSDTQRLVGLANLLKSEVAASGAETMTPEMLHQMDEIEKLARSVKDKMRN